MSAQSPLKRSLPDAASKYFRLLAFFNCVTVPRILFTRACKPSARWNYTGELEYSLPITTKVPSGLLDLVEEAKKRGIVTVEGAMWSQSYTMSEEWKGLLTCNLLSTTIKATLFDILNIVIQAFPEAWSEILWEEVEDQLWDVVQSTCVPFLGVLDIRDIIEYLSDTSRAEQGQYLTSLLKFLIRLSTRLKSKTPPSVFALISHGIRLSQDLDVPLTDLQYLQLLKLIAKALSGADTQLSNVAQDLQNLNHHGSMRSNATIGLALGSLPSSWIASCNRQRCPWTPFSEDNISTMEILAQGQLFGNTALIRILNTGWNSLSLETRVLVALQEARKKCFENAREILEQAIMEVEESYGAMSMEFLLIGTSLINSCNATAREVAGEGWAQLIWSKQFGPFTSETLIKSPQHTYLMVAMADSFLGQGKYDDAEHLLLKILKYPSTASNIAMSAALRLLKMSRRRRADSPSFGDWTMLKTAVRKFHEVSDLLKYECLEEAVCFLSALDSKNVIQTSQASEIVNTLSHYRVGAYVGSATFRRNLRENVQALQQYRNNFNVFSVSGPQLYYCRKIRDRFPHATIEFTEKLCAAIWQRYKRIQEMPALAVEDEESDRESGIEPPMPNSTFTDSGLGSSIQAESNGLGSPTQIESKAARSVASFCSFMSCEDDAAKLPTMPPEISAGDYVRKRRCNICKRIIKDVSSEGQWKRHVYADLRPYVCIVEDCNADPMRFASRTEFAAHLTDHRYIRLWACTKCGLTETTQELVQDHIFDAHASQSDAGCDMYILEKNVPRDLSSQQCPFCGEIPGATGFVGHLCHHLEEVSLSALSQEAELEEDIAESLSLFSQTSTPQDKEVDVNVIFEDRRTTLHQAAHSGHEAGVRLLLEKGADVNAKECSSKWTALHQAADNGHEAVVRLLLERGADVNAKERSSGWTALHLAADNGHEAVVRLLLEKGDANVKDRDGWTALRQAAENGHEAVVRLLLERGADVNARDGDGWTALHQATENGHEAVVQLLAPLTLDS